MSQPMPQPYPPYRYASVARPNMTPVAVEAVAAFFGIYGIGWMMAGRTGIGILLALAGFLWDTIALGLVSTGVGIFCTLPLHAVFITLSAVLLSNYIKGRR
jgi:hypothetical protein